MEKLVKAACEAFIMALTKAAVEAMLSFITKVTAVRVARPASGTAKPLREQVTHQPELGLHAAHAQGCELGPAAHSHG